MKNTRRLKRMARAKRNRAAGLSLTSLMDVFTILVLYLLVNQSSVQIEEPPKEVELPDSIAEVVPRETVVVMVSDIAVMIQEVEVISIAELLANKGSVIVPVRDVLMRLKDEAPSGTPEAVEKAKEVTIMAHRKLPFKVLKALMSTSTSAGYTKISLAVNQKAAP
ncbi:MAG: biopolymer transporter ExbD [Pseudomonadota bacterium]